jgi:kumamolisin
MRNPSIDEQIRRRAIEVSDPDSPSYGQHLTRERLAELLGPVSFTSGEPEGEGEGEPGELTPRQAALESKGAAYAAGASVEAVAFSVPEPPGVSLGVSPAEIAQIYGVPSGYDGSGETIGVLNLASIPLAAIQADLALFWRKFGIKPPEISELCIGEDAPSGNNMIARFDLTANVSWIGAMAPGARIVLYDMGPNVGDPWTAMVKAAVAGQGGATVLTSAWTTPEIVYYRQFRRRTFSQAMMQASLRGITMVNCAGNWGAYDGRPQQKYQGRMVCPAPWPNGIFPVVDPWVLGAGGTMITRHEPLTEVAWSGPLPPNAQIRAGVSVFNFAGSGGFSGVWGVPPWQQPALNQSDGTPRGFSRGPNTPAVFPFGRAYPDVALMASGPAVQRPGAKDLSMAGYQIFFDGEPIDYAGGTSVATPIWGAFIALMNQARRANGLPRLGFANPLFYKLAAGGGGSFRAIESGRADLAFRVVDSEGAVARYELAGFDAGPGWNPVTGVGVPRVGQLIEAVNTVGQRATAKARAT